MDFEPVTQNGIETPTEYFIAPSRFALAVSTTTFSVVDTLTLKAYSDAQIYKRKPVTFYKIFNNSTSVIGVGTWISTTTCALINTRITTTGTNEIYASWPGELKYAPKSTEFNTISVTVAPAATYNGTLSLTTSINPTNTFKNPTVTLVSSIGTTITGQVLFRARQTMSSPPITVGSGFFSGNRTTATIDTSLLASSSTWILQGEWNGGLINGSPYYGASSNTLTQIVNSISLVLTNSTYVTERYNSGYGFFGSNGEHGANNNTFTVDGEIPGAENKPYIGSQIIRISNNNGSYNVRNQGLFVTAFERIYIGQGGYGDTYPSLNSPGYYDKITFNKPLTGYTFSNPYILYYGEATNTSTVTLSANLSSGTNVTLNGNITYKTATQTLGTSTWLAGSTSTSLSLAPGFFNVTTANYPPTSANWPPYGNFTATVTAYWTNSSLQIPITATMSNTVSLIVRP